MPSRNASPRTLSGLLRADRPRFRAAIPLLLFGACQLAIAQPAALHREPIPPRVAEVQRFLAQRNQPTPPTSRELQQPPAALARPQSSGSTGSSATWQPLGPAAVSTSNFGLVSGRVSSIAFDPADVTGNRVYIGTTGGGVWLSQNAATANNANVQFTPLTDTVGAMMTAIDASISLGAITVQPGATGVVLAGTGDPNDALDSYYGAGILRSTDSGSSWRLISTTADHQWTFMGESFAGFAWSTLNPQLVVAAVSQSLDAVITNATRANTSYEGLYYSSDSGATWSLARITDGGSTDVQGPLDIFASPDGNAATSVVWNPVRKLFLAAVRLHGYYQSSDGITWTRLSAQPGTGLTHASCPTNPGRVGSLSCPIFRGTLAVNPLTGDTFAWTVDAYNQDQGLWQDQCGLVAGACANQNIAFGKQWSTGALQTNDPTRGPATIENGDYTLALAAVPSTQDTVLLAGANDLWKCSLTAGCVWRNTTNAGACATAQVSPYQHALAWSATNPSEILIGNDGGLWRSLDAIGVSGSACNASDATHFQNLNGGLGSLAEVESMSVAGSSPDAMMTGLGVNGTAGVKTLPGPAAEWPQILNGYGGPTAIDPANPSNWYVNNQIGVSIHACSQSDACTQGDFGSSPVISNADVGGDGASMPLPAPFLIDPLDPSQLLVATCRVWRGPANGAGWSSANAISPFLDGAQGTGPCNGDPFIRTIAAMDLGNGSEVVYLGMYGPLEGGGALAGHVFRAIYTPNASANPTWQDLTANPVTNDIYAMNRYGFDISSIFIDPHDSTGNTIYITVLGMPEPLAGMQPIYRSTDGGAHWQSIYSNLMAFPANAVVVDPQDANTVYVAIDAGVFSTRQIASCAQGPCWSAYGSGLPEAPVTQLTAAGNTLVAGTYGRGVWQIPLWTGESPLTTVTVAPGSLTFASQSYDSTSAAQTVTVTNTGTVALTISSLAASGDFNESDTCQNLPIAAGGSCTVQVTFTPTQAGTRTGQLTIEANIQDGQVLVPLSGIGQNPTGVSMSPSTLGFGSVALGTTTTLQVTVENATASAVPVTSIAATGPFALATNACGATLPAHSDCALSIAFTPTLAGNATGTLTLVDSAGTQTATLNGNGAAPPTDTLSLTTLTFPPTVVGQISAPQTVSLTNSGGIALNSIAATIGAPFQVSGNCTTQLAANSSCAFAVVFDPSSSGPQNGALTIADALRTQTVALMGTGLAPPQIGVSPVALNFPVQSIGAAGSPIALTITNTGGAAMANIGFQIVGVSSGSFAVSATTCGATLGAGSSCTAQVVFTPTAAGGAAATLTISSTSLGVKAAQVPLSGTGQAPAGINVSPAQMTFTAATLEQASPSQTATVTNSGSQAAQALTLVASPPFSVSQSSCGSTLAAGASCSAGVIFTPIANGSASGTLTVASTTSNSAVVLLSGIGGIAGSLQMQPSVLSFPVTGAGTTSSAQTLTLTNTGPVDLTAMALNASSGFQLVTTNCVSTLVIGASCTAAIAFTPPAAGQQNGTLTVTSKALAVPVQATLFGMGFDFDAAISGTSSQTIANGQMASFTLVLSPKNGSSGTFSLQCGSLPAGAACSFNPTNQTVGANATGNVTVQIATGHAATLVHGPGRKGWLPGVALCGLLLLPIALRRSRTALGLVALATILIGGVASCSGAGGGTGGSTVGGQGSSNSSVGTYSIPVKVAANGITHSVTLTLTVD